jgi:[ribosomal protein S18]-alanine N-acetyltransferase
MNIRRANRNDLAEILKIAAANVRASQWPEAEYTQAIENVASRRMVLVAEAEGAGVVGFIVSHCVDKDWEIENIAVTPERQRKGIGQALMRVFMEIAKLNGAEHIFLEVRQSNSTARILYERCGFLHAGERKSYYRNPPEDAVLYRYLCSSELLENR